MNENVWLIVQEDIYIYNERGKFHYIFKKKPSKACFVCLIRYKMSHHTSTVLPSRLGSRASKKLMILH